MRIRCSACASDTRTDNPGKKERLPVDIVLKTNSYSCDNKEQLKAYDVRINEYYCTRDCSKRDDNWDAADFTDDGQAAAAPYEGIP